MWLCTNLRTKNWVVKLYKYISKSNMLCSLSFGKDHKENWIVHPKVNEEIIIPSLQRINFNEKSVWTYEKMCWWIHKYIPGCHITYITVAATIDKGFMVLKMWVSRNVTSAAPRRRHKVSHRLPSDPPRSPLVGPQLTGGENWSYIMEDPQFDPFRTAASKSFKA